MPCRHHLAHFQQELASRYEPRHNQAVRGLYPIVDVELLERRTLDCLDFLAALLQARPPLVQLRAKQLGAHETLELLRACTARARPLGVKLIANDRPDLAQLAGCDGVHVGQADLPVSQVRRCFPALLVGVSTHDLPQLEAALAEGPDYVAFGPVFPTASKQDPDPVVGLEGLRAAAARIGGRCPLVAIGGVTEHNAAEVAEAAELAAVIGALVPESAALGEVTERAERLGRLLAR